MMKMIYLGFFTALLLGIVACKNDTSTDVALDETPAKQNAKESAKESAKAGSVDGNKKAAVTVAPPVISDGPEMTSVYTKIRLDECRINRHSAESSSTTYYCEGYNNIPVIVHDGDGRAYIGVGHEKNTHLISLGGFNGVQLPEATAEWRLADGKPVAMIIRIFNFTSYPEIDRYSNLAVYSIATVDQKGCPIGFVSVGAKPSQNAVARMVADKHGTEGIPCRDDVRHLHELATE